MATGLEVAGVVLGTIPMLLAGLQFYAEGIGVTKRYWQYRAHVNDILVELRSENSLYFNTINMLLVGVVDQKEMALFLAEPGGDRWKNAHFDRRLKKRLGASYVSYWETVARLSMLVEQFKEKLKLDSSGKTQFNEKNAFKEHYKRLKFSIKKLDYKELMNNLRQANQTLYRLTTQTLHLAAQQPLAKRGDNPMPDFESIKIRADKFYLALNHCWECMCQTDHSVNLRLQTRTEIGSSDDESDDESMRDPFHVLFRYSHHQSQNNHPTRPWIWEEADARVEIQKIRSLAKPGNKLYSTKGVKFASTAVPKAIEAALQLQPNLKPIKDLCSAIGSLQQPQRDVCFSLLANEIAVQKYGVFITPIPQLPLDTNSWSVASLHTVLRDRRFVSQARLKLAITLASSVLQLHETSWLSEDWGKEDIFFLKRFGEINYDQPFVSQNLHRTPAAKPKPVTQMSRIILNRSLFALGVVLIELHYKQPLSELYEDIDGALNTGDLLLDRMTEFNTADRLSEELLSEAGVNYSDAVRRCIRCDFEQRASKLENLKFQKSVYQDVVAQLQEDYEHLFEDHRE